MSSCTAHSWSRDIVCMYVCIHTYIMNACMYIRTYIHWSHKLHSLSDQHRLYNTLLLITEICIEEIATLLNVLSSVLYCQNCANVCPRFPLTIFHDLLDPPGGCAKGLLPSRAKCVRADKYCPFQAD